MTALICEMGGASDADQLSGTTPEVFLSFVLAFKDSRIKKNIDMFGKYVRPLKGIYPEFQVIRGFSQKIPAGLLSYDQIHS